jgi:hypothetical protein
VTTSDNTEQDLAAVVMAASFRSLMDAFAQLTPEQEEQLGADNEEIQLAADAYALGREYLERGQRTAAERWLRMAARHHMPQAQQDLDNLDFPDLDGDGGPGGSAAPERPFEIVVPTPVCDSAAKKWSHGWNAVTSPPAGPLVGAFSGVRPRDTRHILAAAHSQAEEILATARREAELAVATARSEAEEVLATARRQAEDMAACAATPTASTPAAARWDPACAASSLAAVRLVPWSVPKVWPPMPDISALRATMESVAQVMRQTATSTAWMSEIALDHTAFAKRVKDAMHAKDFLRVDPQRMPLLILVATGAWNRPELSTDGHTAWSFSCEDHPVPSSLLGLVEGKVVAVHDITSPGPGTAPLALPGGREL